MSRKDSKNKHYVHEIRNDQIFALIMGQSFNVTELCRIFNILSRNEITNFLTDIEKKGYAKIESGNGKKYSGNPQYLIGSLGNLTRCKLGNFEKIIEKNEEIKRLREILSNPMKYYPKHTTTAPEREKEVNKAMINLKKLQMEKKRLCIENLIEPKTKGGGGDEIQEIHRYLSSNTFECLKTILGHECVRTEFFNKETLQSLPEWENFNLGLYVQKIISELITFYVSNFEFGCEFFRPAEDYEFPTKHTELGQMLKKYDSNTSKENSTKVGKTIKDFCYYGNKEEWVYLNPAAEEVYFEKTENELERLLDWKKELILFLGIPQIERIAELVGFDFGELIAEAVRYKWVKMAQVKNPIIRARTEHQLKEANEIIEERNKKDTEELESGRWIA